MEPATLIQIETKLVRRAYHVVSARISPVFASRPPGLKCCGGDRSQANHLDYQPTMHAPQSGR